MIRIKESIIIGFIVLAFLSSLKSPALAQQDIPSLIKSARPAVVLIIAYDSLGNTSSQGSGFFISPRGEVVTNWHVVDNTTKAMVITATRAVYFVKGVIAKDEQKDIVKLAIEAKNVSFPFLKLSPKLPQIGEQIFAIGNPSGLESTVSDGIVSGLRTIKDTEKVIQISAPISSGSSGGPVINLKGEVVGIASFTLMEGQNLNFAYPSLDIANLSKVKSTKIMPLSLVDTFEARFRAAKRYAQISLPPMLDSLFEVLIEKIPDEKKDDNLIQKIREFMDDKFLKKNVEIMIKHYTVEELNALADFYDRPMGKSIMKKFGPLMIDVQNYIPEFIKEVNKIVMDYKKGQ